jgi:DNA-binding response OmpR family regulator
MMAQKAFLVLQVGADEEGERWSLEAETTSIGRWDGNDIVLSDREVSRRHAQIRHDAGQYVLVDLGSKNGTLVNGARIERATVLADGDELTIAPRFRLLFVDAEATVPSTSRPRGIRIDAASKRITISGIGLEPPLAPNQFALLQLLASDPGRVFSRDEIADVCYPDAEGGVSDQAIDGLIRRLRSRLAEVDPDTDYIVALRGHGIRLAQ